MAGQDECTEHGGGAGNVRESRYERQFAVLRWVRATFGENTINIEERMSRFIEEAIELAQAEGLSIDRVRAITEHVYSKPAGTPEQEVGGIGVTLLAYCATAHIDAENEEIREWMRVQAIPVEQFRKRHDAKADAGIASRSGDMPRCEAVAARIKGSESK